MSGDREEAFGRVERELQQERAAALGRIGRTLETLLSNLDELQVHMTSVSPAEREELIAKHAELRTRAAKYRWYLEVQREAVGIRSHRSLDEIYPIPTSLRTDPGFN
jgi:hypothetical protein